MPRVSALPTRLGFCAIESYTSSTTAPASRPAAVVLSVEHLESLEETLDVGARRPRRPIDVRPVIAAR